MIEIHRSITKVNTFAERLLQARRARKMSQTALARASGVSQSAIASYERGLRMTAKGIFKLAQALQVDPAWLGMGVGSMDPESSTNAIRLHEPGKDAWPFSTISLQDFWALSASDRMVLEDTLRAMILTLRKHKARG